MNLKNIAVMSALWSMMTGATLAATLFVSGWVAVVPAVEAVNERQERVVADCLTPLRESAEALSGGADVETLVEDVLAECAELAGGE